MLVANLKQSSFLIGAFKSIDKRVLTWILSAEFFKTDTLGAANRCLIDKPYNLKFKILLDVFVFGLFDIHN